MITFTVLKQENILMMISKMDHSVGMVTETTQTPKAGGKNGRNVNYA
jgi:hypothetical protein